MRPESSTMTPSISAARALFSICCIAPRSTTPSTTADRRPPTLIRDAISRPDRPAIVTRPPVAHGASARAAAANAGRAVTFALGSPGGSDASTWPSGRARPSHRNDGSFARMTAKRRTTPTTG